MNILYVGDPHVKPSNLEESERLMEFVLSTAKTSKAQRIVLMGDLMHTMAVVRLEVLDFWNRWLEKLASEVTTIVLVGNHDMATRSEESINSLNVFKRMELEGPLLGSLLIIDKPSLIEPFLYMPYIHDQGRFLSVVNSFKGKAKTLVCHQDINGSQFESGFYSPGGVDPDKIQMDLMIGGHIHKRQRFGKVILPGTARWDSASDANEEKGLWLVHHDVNGGIVAETFIDTSSVCSPIIQVSWKEGEEAPLIKENARVTVELIGSSTWINKQKTSLKGKVNIKSKITDKNNRQARKAGPSLEFFFKNIFVSNKNKDRLMELAKEWELV